VVSLACTAVTAMDALECVRNETAMLLLASSQAVDLRGGPRNWRRFAPHLRFGSPGGPFQDVDRPMEREVADVAAQISSGLIERVLEYHAIKAGWDACRC